jgi:hypothetical protein
MMQEHEKVSLAKCKKVLQSKGKVYTDEQVIAIRDFLYQMAEWDYALYMKLKKRELDFTEQNQSQNSELDEAA